MLLYNKINAIIAATRFLKKLFSIDGRSPDSFTHKFIIEKPNAEILNKEFPLWCNGIGGVSAASGHRFDPPPYTVG